jgi:hypothetical protein
MTSNHYHFITHWRVQSTVKEVTEVLGNAPDLTRWWPAVYLAVQEVEPGDERGVGKVIDLYTKGWLPYTLRWRSRITEVTDRGFTLEASGDFVGRGVWTFAQDGPWVDVTYDWQIAADKPLLRYLSFVMKPIFSFNHLWAMARGEESLKLELARRQAATEAAHARIPAPPAATTTSVAPLLLATAVFLGVTAVLLSRLIRSGKAIPPIRIS